MDPQTYHDNKFNTSKLISKEKQSDTDDSASTKGTVIMSTMKLPPNLYIDKKIQKSTNSTIETDTSLENDPQSDNDHQSYHYVKQNRQINEQDHKNSGTV